MQLSKERGEAEEDELEGLPEAAAGKGRCEGN